MSPFFAFAASAIVSHFRRFAARFDFLGIKPNSPHTAIFIAYRRICKKLWRQFAGRIPGLLNSAAARANLTSPDVNIL
ncbi:MAG: hypothetical protein LBJ73_01135 [Rickettsiales bacterium]|jgi:hypothetical protein|nr:hypothetical protein [Rickettsiales bacterium]